MGAGGGGQGPCILIYQINLNVFQIKREINRIKQGIVGDIRNIFKSEEDNNFYKPVTTGEGLMEGIFSTKIMVLVINRHLYQLTSNLKKLNHI